MPIGIVLNLLHTDPATDTAADRRQTRASDGYTNRWYLDPLFRGAYPIDTQALFEGVGGVMDFLSPGDLEAISEPIDFLGVNYYSPRIVRAAAPGEASEFGWVVEKPPLGAPVTDGGWQISPEAFTSVLVRIQREYGPLPIFVTENGAICDDVPDDAGRVHDPCRIDYLTAHIRAAHRAIDAGVDLRGYCVWSLLDNFEWADGYSKRFGIVYVDYPTQQRIPKSSFAFMSQVIRRGGIPWEGDEDALRPGGEAAGLSGVR